MSNETSLMTSSNLTGDWSIFSHTCSFSCAPMATCPEAGVPSIWSPCAVALASAVMPPPALAISLICTGDTAGW
jgi:hypothetical protein